MLIPFCWAYSTEFQSLAKYQQICNICQTCRIRRPVGTLLLSLFNCISVFGQISSNLPYLPSSPNSLNSLLCWYLSLELIQLNFSLWPNIIRFAICAKFVEFPALLVPFSWVHSTEFQSLAKYRQICHICQVRRIRWIRCSVGTLLLSLFNWISVFGQISSDLPYVLSSVNSPPCWYPSPEFIQLNFSVWRNIVTFTIFAKFVEIVEFASLLVPFSWAYSTEFQSLAKYHQICHICQIRRIPRPVDTLLLSLFNWILVFSEISSNFPYLPSSSNSLKSSLCWYPSLELIQLNFSFWRNIVIDSPSLRNSSNSLNSPLCWYPSLELIQLNFSLWPNINRFALCAKFVEFPALLVPFSWVHSTEFQSLAKYRQICHICQVRRIRWIRCSVGTLLLSLFNWISVFGQISSDLPYLPNSSNSPPC